MSKTTEWISTQEFSRRWSRPCRTVRQWCFDGTLLAFGFRIHRFPTRHRNRTWIEVPKVNTIDLVNKGETHLTA